jgi:colanic acid/amylovoran biosynthesis glycosyltransferase
VKLATGKFIAFLDSDDQWLPNAISLMVEALEITSADFVYSPIYEVYDDVHEFISYPVAANEPDRFKYGHYLTNRARPCSVMYKKEIFEGTMFDETMPYNEDSDFLQRVAMTHIATYLSVPTAKVFNHGGNKSANRVGIYTALMESSLGILSDFPKFAQSMGEKSEIRIKEIKSNLVEQLVIKGRIAEALSVSEGMHDFLRSDVRLSLLLRSVIPVRFFLSSQATIKTVRNFYKRRKIRKRSMKIMHLFGTYLPMTENWCYRLIKHLPDSHLYIVAEKSDNEGLFVLSNSLYLVMPTAEWPMAPHPFIKNGVKLVCMFLRKLWMRFVAHFARKSSIMHAHFSYMGWNYLHLAEVTKTPMVVSYYGYDYEYLPKSDPVWSERYAKMFGMVAMFITEGGIGRSKLIAMGCPKEKVKVVHLGVETSLIPFYKRIKNTSELRLVQVATFTGKKGHDLTVKAFIIAASRCPGITLTLVGKDPEGVRAPLQQTIREAGLDSQVEFIDGIDFTKLHHFLKPFQLFIHPSKYGKNDDSEGGAPVVLLDAQATGLPVLSTEHCDIPEEVIHGETGRLVSEGDVDGLVAEIEMFYEMNQTEYTTYCENARRHMEKNYDSVECGRQLKEVYEGILKANFKQ